MLPERLAFSLAVFMLITLIYLSLEHDWSLETTLVAVLAGTSLSLIVGRLFGRISAKELVQNVEESEKDEGAPTRAA